MVHRYAALAARRRWADASTGSSTVRAGGRSLTNPFQSGETLCGLGSRDGYNVLLLLLDMGGGSNTTAALRLKAWRGVTTLSHSRRCDT